ncbi:hypothetical protein [Pedobacter psychrodurus]|uniref:hypothetical protein n=1 Tax=Pedobacter psychrodurus TaxID=2530456 RepID=UPI00292EA06A|nr:hypothetical protein [Pedobacter psychrodurus]
MKKLELVQLENVLGGKDAFWTGAACAGTLILAGAFIYGTAGTGAVIGVHAAAVACGGLIGYGASTGSWF